MKDRSSAAQRFLLWGVATLRESGAALGEKELRLHAGGRALPSAHAARWGAGEAADAQLLHQVIQELQSHGGWQHATPSGQAKDIDEIAAKLVSHYEINGGVAELKSLALEDRPILRLTFAAPHAASPATELQHLYFWPDGEELDDTVVDTLLLDDLVAWHGAPPEVDPQRVRRWIDACRARLRRSGSELAEAELIVSTLVWCQHLTGRIELSAGESATSISLAGWVQPWMTGNESPPPYRCPLTNLETYRLGVTSDGRIVPREVLAQCEETHRWAMLSDLQRCGETRKRVERELLAPCMATGKLVLRRLLETCSQCNQPVAPSVLHGGRCIACRKLAPVSNDDPRMARLLGEYPKLDRWRHWRLSETENTYVLASRSWVRQVLLVVHKETLSTLYAAVAGRIWSPWQEMTQLQRDDLLG